MATTINKRKQPKTSVRKVGSVKTVSIKKRTAKKASSPMTSKLNLVRLTRNELYLPEDYKIVLDCVRKGYATTRELIDLNPLKRKSTKLGVQEYYYIRLKLLAEFGLLEKERQSYHNGRTCITEYNYTAVELTPVKLGSGEFLDVSIRL